MTRLDSSAERLQAMLDRLAAGEARAAVQDEIGSDADLALMLSLAEDLGTALPAAPRPAFRARLQADLQDRMAAAPVRPSAAGARRRGWRFVPRLAALAAAVVLVLGSAVATSAQSVPGEPLYPLKRAVEETRLAVARTPDARLRQRQSMADARLDEVQTLVERGLSPAVTLLDDLVAAQDAALSEARAMETEAAAAAERGAWVRAEELDRLSGGVEHEARAAMRDAADAMRGAVATATVSAPTPMPDTPTPAATMTGTAEPTALPSATATVLRWLPRWDPRARSTPVTPDAPESTPVPTRRRVLPRNPEGPPPAPPTYIVPVDPGTMEPTEAPPLPTLRRASEREATLTAEAAPTEKPPPPTPFPTMRPTRPWPTWPPRRSGGGDRPTPIPTQPIGRSPWATPVPPSPQAP